MVHSSYPSRTRRKHLKNPRLHLMMVWSRGEKAPSQLPPISYEGLPFPEPENSWHPCAKDNSPGGPADTRHGGPGVWTFHSTRGLTSQHRLGKSMLHILPSVLLYSQLHGCTDEVSNNTKTHMPKVYSSVSLDTCIYPEKL